MISQNTAAPPKQADPSAIAKTWPLCDRSLHFDFGHILSSLVTDAIAPQVVGELSPHHAGCWECDLLDDSLVWSGGVYDIFGFPRDASIRREQALALYCEDSRAKLENLRTCAIKLRRGFTLDVNIRSEPGELRRVRLVGIPICSDDRAVRLQGLKLVI